MIVNQKVSIPKLVNKKHLKIQNFNRLKTKLKKRNRLRHLLSAKILNRMMKIEVLLFKWINIWKV